MPIYRIMWTESCWADVDVENEAEAHRLIETDTIPENLIEKDWEFDGIELLSKDKKGE